MQNYKIPEHIKNKYQQIDKQKETNMMALVGEELASGAVSLADLPLGIANLWTAAQKKILPASMGKYIPVIEDLEYPSEKLKNYLKKKGYKFEEPKTAGERITGKASNFIGSLAGGMGLGAAAKGTKLATALVPSSGKELAKQTAMAGTSGAVSGSLQEMGANPLVADVAGILGTPAAISSAKKLGRGLGAATKGTASLIPGVGEEAKAAKVFQGLVGQENIQKTIENIKKYESKIGYKPTTAEIAESAAIAQLYRAREANIGTGIPEAKMAGKKTIQETMGKLSPEGSHVGETQEYLSNVGRLAEESRGRLAEHHRNVHEKQLSQFERKAEPREAGQKIQEKLHEKKSTAKKHREHVTEPLYEKLKDIQQKTTPEHSLDYIREHKKYADRDTRSILGNYERELSKNPPSEKRYEHLGPKAIESIKKQISTESGTEIAKLENIRKGLNKRLGIIGNNPNRQDEKRLLMGLKEKLTEDMSIIPEALEARKTYAELSKPVNEITEHPVFGKVVKQNVYRDQFLMRPEDVPEKFIKGMKSKQNASDLKNMLSHDKDSMRLMENYINGDLYNKVISPSGKVNEKALHTWKVQNPGAFELYPHLETKLKNSSNSQAMLSEIENKNQKFINRYYKDILRGVTDLDPNQVVNRIMTGPGKGKKSSELLNIIKKDKNAIQGLRQGVAEHLTRAFEGKSDYLHTKLNKYMQDKRHILEQIYEPEQMELLDELLKVTKGKSQAESLGIGQGSQTSPHLLNNMQIAISMSRKAISSLFGRAAGKPASAILDFLLDDKTRRIDKLINKGLSDPDYAKLLLEKPLKNKESYNSVLKDVTEYFSKKPYLMVPSIASRPEKDK